jgi:hypothetical protein
VEGYQDRTAAPKSVGPVGSAARRLSRRRPPMAQAPRRDARAGSSPAATDR